MQSQANASLTPKLNFTDLISGSGAGLDDGAGSGIIVTLWGQHLGNSQGDSKVYFEDVVGGITEVAHSYYWKNADGAKPGGISNLYDSHRMQEIAVSMPDAVSGDGFLFVEVDGEESNKLPFSIREGGIFHVSPTGTDSAESGTYNQPWATIQYALDSLSSNPGSTIYLHDDLLIGGIGVNRAIFWDESNASGTTSNQFSIVAYPGSHPLVMGTIGITNFGTTGLVLSKLLVQASHPDCVELANGQPECGPGLLTLAIRGSKDGRAVGNALTDIPGYCANGRDGALSVTHIGGDDQVSNMQVYGNEIYEYGCEGSSKFTHTTYFTVRNRNDNQVDPWRFAFNYLHDNDSKYGIHHYDQLIGEFCGSPTGVMRIHDNVVINQAGSGISLGGALACDWTADFEIYNNILINTGRVSSWDGLDTSTAFAPATSAIFIQNSGLSGDLRIFNNTIVDWNPDVVEVVTDGSDVGYQACIVFFGRIDEDHNTNQILFSENICSTKHDKPFLITTNSFEGHFSRLEGSINNIWHYDSITDPNYAINPDEFLSGYFAGGAETGVSVDPLISVNRSILSLGHNSPAKNGATLPYTQISHDIYGIERVDSLSEIGAVEIVIVPKPPTNLMISN